ncbi:mitogen-activated protein kinase kinase kinase 9-like isoform X2 [Tamandua tetradactyla]|uniref:mitogen-activated protein kinase kinase kinase 9-like isoform X2 n=1 Tax=Tamandua tetradactyla TaxID=48850 RepID=UPI004054138F
MAAGPPPGAADAPRLPPRPAGRRRRALAGRAAVGAPRSCWSPPTWTRLGTPSLQKNRLQEFYQELRTWEEELTWAALQQKNLEELLQHKGQELAEWEIDILEWELNIILHQLCQEKPRLKKSMGKFRKSWLKLKDSNHISLPSDNLESSSTS